jgi:hypothetical protein
MLAAASQSLVPQATGKNLNVGWYWYSIVGLKAFGVASGMFHQDCAIPVAEIVKGCRAFEERRDNSARKRSAAEEDATQRSQSEIEGSSSSPNWVQAMNSVVHGVWYHPRQGF